MLDFYWLASLICGIQRLCRAFWNVSSSSSIDFYLPKENLTIHVFYSSHRIGNCAKRNIQQLVQSPDLLPCYYAHDDTHSCNLIFHYFFCFRPCPNFSTFRTFSDHFCNRLFNDNLFPDRSTHGIESIYALHAGLRFDHHSCWCSWFITRSHCKSSCKFDLLKLPIRKTSFNYSLF